MPWEVVCEALGITAHSRALPTTLGCPLCGKTALHVFNDNVCTGAWHHCHGCQSRGDMLDLAAAFWRVTRAAAAGRCGLKPALLVRATAEAEARERADELWRRASKDYLAATMERLQKLRRMYNLLLPIRHEDWTEFGSDLVGAADVETIRQFARKHSDGVRSKVFGKDPAGEIRKGGHGIPDRMEALMVRYESNPGRICAFAGLVREGRRVKDDFYIPVWPTNDRCNRNKWEGGLYGLSTVIQAAHNQSVIAVDDWMLALQCQMRTLRSQLRPMPIVAWRDAGKHRTRAAWQGLEGRQVIFWGTELTVPLLIQAVETSGRIALLSWPDRQDQPALAQFLRDRGGQDIHGYIERHAKPWETVLYRWLIKHQKSRAWLDFREQLEAAGGDLAYIVQQIKQPRLSKQALPVREIRIGRSAIVEQGDHWLIRTVTSRKGSELLNCTLRITHIVRDTEDPDHGTYYYGRIAYNGHHIPFLERTEVVREKTAQWIAHVVEKSGLGAVSYANDHKGHLHQVALMFHTPIPVSEPITKWRRKLPDPETRPYREARAYHPEPARTA